MASSAAGVFVSLNYFLEKHCTNVQSLGYLDITIWALYRDTFNPTEQSPAGVEDVRIWCVLTSPAGLHHHQLPVQRNFIHLGGGEQPQVTIVQRECPQESDTEYTYTCNTPWCKYTRCNICKWMYVRMHTRRNRIQLLEGRPPLCVREYLACFHNFHSLSAPRQRVIQDNCPSVIPRSLSEDMGCV